MNLSLALRERSVLFFNYVFPLIFFFAFGQFFGASTGGTSMLRVVATVIILGVLGSGLFGAGMRAVSEREAGILRRYKVAPITPLPLLVSSLVTGWLLYIPSVVLMIILAHFVYKMPWPGRPVSLFLLVSLGIIAFRALGLIIAAVANSMAESNILIQILYMPMLFLSGATIPISAMPLTAQIIAQFLPAAYLNTAVQHVLVRAQGLGTTVESVGALLLTTILGLFISSKLFRWEKEEKLPNQSKAWVAAVLLPFVVLGCWQAWSRQHINEAKLLDRELRRNYIRLIRGATIFVGDGTVIPHGAVLLKNGRIEEVYSDRGPEPESLNADPLEAAGKTIIPGLIDVHVHLGAPGGTQERRDEAGAQEALQRELAAYLYCGITAVKSAGDFTSATLAARQVVRSGELLGAELFVSGPLFTASNGHGTEYFRGAPEQLRKLAEQEFTRLPQTADQAHAQVHALWERNADAIKAVLEAGVAGMLFQRLDLSVLEGIANQARADGLPLSVHTGEARDVADAVQRDATSIEHGSARDSIADETFAEMARRGVFYDPTLSVFEAIGDVRDRQTRLLDRPLLQQAGPPELLEATRDSIESQQQPDWMVKYPLRYDAAVDNLLRAMRAGVPLVAGSDAGNMLVIHGPTVHHELELWVKAGIPAAVALQAATYNAARLLRASHRIGLVKKGYEASIVVIDGNPMEDISALDHVSSIFFRGERVDRGELFDQK
jgi:imidazolonepropionase-like amidohydrolase/ABC-type multidrug transport system permease subunit